MTYTVPICIILLLQAIATIGKELQAHMYTMYAHGCHGNLLSFYIIHNIILYHWLTYYILRKYYDINSHPYMYRMI